MEISALLDLIAKTGGLMGLAIFAIWMLNRAHKEREADQATTIETERNGRQVAMEHERADRTTLLEALNRNTQAWVAQTKSMVSVANTLASLVVSMSASRETVQDIRVLLAKRPCIVSELAEQRQEDELLAERIRTRKNPNAPKQPVEGP